MRGDGGSGLLSGSGGGGGRLGTGGSSSSKGGSTANDGGPSSDASMGNGGSTADGGLTETGGTGGTSSATGGTRNGTGGTSSGGTGGASSGGTGGASNGGTGGTQDLTPYLSPDGTYFIKEPPGNLPIGPDAPGADYCFNLVAHNAQAPLASDPSRFQVKTAEFYHQFYFKVPYDQPAWALSTRPIIDNSKVLTEWLFLQMANSQTDGAHVDEIGLQLNNTLLTAWSPGGNPLDMPKGVGLEMPAPGGFVSLEHHYYNTTGAVATDRSGVRVCVTYTMPTHPASLTWLGTENINVPANAQGSATGTCTTWKKNGDVHIVEALPRMRRLGTHMRTLIDHADGGTEIVIDQQFVYTQQRAYATDVVVHADDTLSTTCTWQNNTAAAVGFGTAMTSENCYNLVVYYPAHALDGTGGIEGSKNMCLF